jgi:hypothetical protein
MSPVPNLFQALYGVLISAAPSIALFCFITAGFQLRNEGGVNFSSNGGFFKWIAWGAIFSTLSGILAWFVSEHFLAAAQPVGNMTRPYTVDINQAIIDFVNVYLLAKIVPTIAGALILKSLLDTAEGHSPLPSIISALFLLGVDGFYVQAQTWNDGTPFATASVLQGMLHWALTSVAPVLAVLAIYGAIIQFIRQRDWATYVFAAGALLLAQVLWSLAQSWAGVTLS